MEQITNILKVIEDREFFRKEIPVEAARSQPFFLASGGITRLAVIYYNIIGQAGPERSYYPPRWIGAATYPSGAGAELRRLRAGDFRFPVLGFDGKLPIGTSGTGGLRLAERRRSEEELQASLVALAAAAPFVRESARSVTPELQAAARQYVGHAKALTHECIRPYLASTGAQFFEWIAAATGGAMLLDPPK